MQAKAKIITSIVAVSLVAVISIVGLVVVLAAFTANVGNSYSINYIAKGVCCDVTASYRKATVNETSAGSYTTIMSGSNNKITFNGKDASGSNGTYAANFNALSNQPITKNQYFVLRYIIENNKANSIDMVISLDITTSSTPVNFTVSYAYSTSSTDISTNLNTNRSNFRSSFSSKELPAGSTAYIYVLCEITNLDIDASFVGTANWELVDKNEFDGDLTTYAEIKSGKYVNSAIKGYANSDSNYENMDQNINVVVFGSLVDYSSEISSVTNPIDISINNDGSVMVYRVELENMAGVCPEVYILATDENTQIKFNEDSSYMFYYLYCLETVEFNNIVDTNSVTNMEMMFAYCSQMLTTLDISIFNTSSVTDMYAMFSQCIQLSTIYVGSG